MLAAINELLGDKQGYQEQLQQNIAEAIRSASTGKDDIDEKLMTLQQELIQKANDKERYDAVADEILRLRELKQQNAMDTASRDEQIRRINELQDFICTQPTYLTEFDEHLVKRLLKQIIVYENYLKIELKSGLSIEIEG